jgi:hypothetical protein
MEPTVEMLLQMMGDGGISVQAPATALQAREPDAAPVAAAPTTPPPMVWRNPLPADYLVIPSHILAMSESFTDEKTAQIVADEQLAAILQSERGGRGLSTTARRFLFLPASPAPMLPLDELFMQELSADPMMAAYLRSNPEFAAQLGRNPMRAAGPLSMRSRWESATSNASSHPRSLGASSGSLSDMFRSMGADMKKRFDVLSAKFKRKQSTQPQQATQTVSGRFLGGMFDSRGAYGAIPVDDNIAVNPAHKSAFNDETGRDHVQSTGEDGTASAEVEIELLGTLSRSGIQASANAAAPRTSDTFSLNSGIPGVVASANPAFAIGEEDEDESTPMTSKLKPRHV